MLIEPAYFYILIAIVAVLELILFFTVFNLISLNKSFQKTKLKESAVLEKGREKARDIIENAVDHAAELENEVEVNRESLSKQLETNILKSVALKLEKEIDDQVVGFRKAVTDETLNISQKATARYEEEYTKMVQDLEAEKARRWQKLDEDINEVVGKVALRVVGKAISLRDHEQLVVEALEKAKKEIR